MTGTPPNKPEGTLGATTVSYLTQFQVGQFQTYAIFFKNKKQKKKNNQ